LKSPNSLEWCFGLNLSVEIQLANFVLIARISFLILPSLSLFYMLGILEK
jgi:hypothetical protein